MEESSNLFKSLITKQIIAIIGALFKFFINSIIRYLWLFFLILFTSVYFVLKFNLLSIDSHFVIYPICLIIFAGIPGSFINFARSITLNRQLTGLSLSINEVITIKENEYLDLGFASSNISTQIENEIKSLKSNYSSQALPDILIYVRRRPRLFYLFQNSTSLLNIIRKENEASGIKFSLLITENEKEGQIEFDIIGIRKKGYTIMEDFKSTFSNLTLRNYANRKKLIIEVSKIFISMVSIGSLYDIPEIRMRHALISTNEKILFAGIDSVIKLCTDENSPEILAFKTGWQCEIEILRAHLLLEQAEYIGALKCIFSALSLDPLHPYKSFEEFKDDYNKYNVHGFLSFYQFFYEEFVKRGEKIRPLESTIYESKILYNSMKIPGRPFLHEMILKIQKEAASPMINNVIDEYLKTDFCTSPLKELIKGEVLKFLPIDLTSSQSDDIQIQRCPEVIKNFESVLIFDEHFAYMHIKLAMVRLHYYSSLPASPLVEAELEKTNTIFMRGTHLFAELGINLKNSE